MKRSTLFVAIGSAGALALTGAATGQAQTNGLPSVTMTMRSNAIAVGGELRAGAVSLSVSSSAKDAEPTLVRLNPGVTADQLLAAAARIQDPNDVTPYGSLVFDADAPKGTTTFETVLAAGNYVALNTQGNPAKSPHAAFTVAPSAEEAALPKAAATISAFDFGFKAPKTLKAGSTVRLRNDGWVVHMIVGVQVKNAKAAKRVSALLKAGKDKPAQKLAKGVVNLLGPASHGAVQQMRLTAKPGVYVLVCFMTTQDGREHTRLGMVKTVRVER